MISVLLQVAQQVNRTGNALTTRSKLKCVFPICEKFDQNKGTPWKNTIFALKSNPLNGIHFFFWELFCFCLKNGNLWSRRTDALPTETRHFNKIGRLGFTLYWFGHTQKNKNMVEHRRARSNTVEHGRTPSTTFSLFSTKYIISTEFAYFGKTHFSLEHVNRYNVNHLVYQVYKIGLKVRLSLSRGCGVHLEKWPSLCMKARLPVTLKW
jgi:hypothetical protein